MKKYKVLHWSDNWMMDGLATWDFNTLSEARKYIRDFRSDSKFHNKDKYEILEVLETGKIELVDKDLYGFKKK